MHAGHLPTPLHVLPRKSPSRTSAHHTYPTTNQAVDVQQLFLGEGVRPKTEPCETEHSTTIVEEVCHVFIQSRECKDADGQKTWAEVVVSKRWEVLCRGAVSVGD